MASILPVTVIAAITPFVLEELEFIKRWRAGRRKGQAYRKLLARECGLNLWAHWWLDEPLRDIQQEEKQSAVKSRAVSACSSDA